jgi:hypothetical protein
VRREQERFGNAVEHVLLALRAGQIRIQEMLADALGGLHQVLHPVGANRLHDIGTDCLQQHGHVPPPNSKIRSFDHCTMRAKLA